MMPSKDWIGKRVVIVGVARQGLALAGYLLRQGARVVLNDQKPEEEMISVRQILLDEHGDIDSLECVFGDHPLSLLDGTDMLCLSAGVPLTIPLVVEARSRDIPLSNDSQIFLEAAPCQIAGITGSAGKTTTTSLVGLIANKAVNNIEMDREYRHIWVGGNIGSPLIAEVEEMSSEDLAVVELSSFQLELMTCSPHIAAILNITPNHLDRHKTMQSYTTAKARIMDNQTPTDITVLGHDDPIAWSLAPKVRGHLVSFGFSSIDNDQDSAFLKDDEIYIRYPGVGIDGETILHRRDVPLRGEHNLLNVIAACAICAAAKISVEAMRVGIQDFIGVPHRLEFVRSWGGADWYNDSIATAPERAMAAIRSFNESLVLLAGGRDKDLPWDDFASLVHQRVDHLILFGEAKNKIFQAMTFSDVGKPSIACCECLEEAVKIASRIVQPGDVVLLSPGGTSFDEFKDFEERGKCFAEWVNKLP